MHEVELTSARLARVWWAFAWRFTALWFVLLAVSVFICLLSGFILMRGVGFPEPMVARMMFRASVATMLAGIPVAGLAAVRMVLQNRTGVFRLALLENPQSQREVGLECQVH
jgi:hypothetical protein